MIEEIWKNYSETRTPEAREELIMACLPLVKLYANQLIIYAAPSQDINDLVSAGIIGLIDAITRYDPRKGASFESYAKCRIRGSIIDEIRSMGWAPYSTREKARMVEKAMQELQQSNGKEPSDEEIAEAIGVPLEKYHEMLSEINRMALSMFDETFYDEDMSEVSEGILIENPEELLVNTEMETLLANAIEHLSEKERIVITLYYYEEMTMKEIGEVLNISESRICQIHSSAILRLHTRLKLAKAII